MVMVRLLVQAEKKSEVAVMAKKSKSRYFMMFCLSNVYCLFKLQIRGFDMFGLQIRPNGRLLIFFA
jgi:hypothetical protein